MASAHETFNGPNNGPKELLAGCGFANAQQLHHFCVAEQFKVTRRQNFTIEGLHAFDRVFENAELLRFGNHVRRAGCLIDEERSDRNRGNTELVPTHGEFKNSISFLGTQVKARRRQKRWLCKRAKPRDFGARDHGKPQRIERTGVNGLLKDLDHRWF